MTAPRFNAQGKQVLCDGGHYADACDAAAADAIVTALNAGWRAVDSAPKDRSFILARIGNIASDQWSHLNGRCFVIRHEGYTPSGYDMGWALFPGFGGAPDHWIEHWMPLPDAPTPSPSVTREGGE